jgi:hypothetical protein
MRTFEAQVVFSGTRGVVGEGVKEWGVVEISACPRQRQSPEVLILGIPCFIIFKFSTRICPPQVAEHFKECNLELSFFILFP